MPARSSQNKHYANALFFLKEAKSCKSASHTYANEHVRVDAHGNEFWTRMSECCSTLIQLTTSRNERKPCECVRMYQTGGLFSTWTSEPCGCVFNFHLPSTSALGSRASRKSNIQPSIHRAWSSPGQTNASFYLCLFQCLSVDGEVGTMNHLHIWYYLWLYYIPSICNCNMGSNN